MNLEIIIVGLLVIIIFVAFEKFSIRNYKRTIAKQQKLIQEQEDFIKVLEKDYDILVQKQFEEIKKKLTKK